VLAAQGATAGEIKDAVPLEKLPALHSLIKDHEDYAHLR